jgi:alpha-D-ribose 1-methylphosphonate 5-triphosphate synthase subunit PhnL
MSWIVKINKLNKQFLLHTQDKTQISVFNDFQMSLTPGESAGLVGPSGAGKSTLLRLLYGNYKIDSGEVMVRHGDGTINLATATPHDVLEVRKWTIGYVSQFLRVIPRVPSIEVVMEPLIMRGTPKEEACQRAQTLLKRLRIPSRLWALSPSTFSGGEQQRINIARGFIALYPVLLLDEPTASLDPDNCETVIQIIQETLKKGTTIIGIFHDKRVRDTVVSKIVEIHAAGNTSAGYTQNNPICNMS